MTTLNINLKIEAKKTITSKGIEFLKNNGLGLNQQPIGDEVKTEVFDAYCHAPYPKSTRSEVK